MYHDSYSSYPRDPSPGGGPQQGRYSPVMPQKQANGPLGALPRPSVPQWLLLGGGLLTALSGLLPWWSVTLVLSAKRVTLATSGWESAAGKVVTVLGVLAIALVVSRLWQVTLPVALRQRPRTIAIVLGLETLLLAGLALLDGVRVLAPNGVVTGGAGIGIYVALLGAAAMIAGGWLDRGSAGWLL